MGTINLKCAHLTFKFFLLLCWINCCLYASELQKMSEVQLGQCALLPPSAPVSQNAASTKCLTPLGVAMDAPALSGVEPGTRPAEKRFCPGPPHSRRPERASTTKVEQRFVAIQYCCPSRPPRCLYLKAGPRLAAGLRKHRRMTHTDFLVRFVFKTGQHKANCRQRSPESPQAGLTRNTIECTHHASFRCGLQ